MAEAKTDWLVKCLDGEFVGQVRRIDHRPPEELIMLRTADGLVIGIDEPDYSIWLAENNVFFPDNWPEDWGAPTRYRRKQMSQLPDDDPALGALFVRGAEYEEVQDGRHDSADLEAVE